MPNKRFRLFTVALFAIFAGLSTCCYGYSICGFDSEECPGTFPPCYKVTYNDVNCCGVPAVYTNGTHFLIWGWDCVWGDWSPEPCGSFGYLTLNLEDPYTGDPCTIIISSECDGAFRYWGGYAQSGSGANQSSCAEPGDTGEGGMVVWEPIWDCNKCCACDDLDVNDSNCKDTIYYGNLDCCPPGEKGEYTEIIYECNDADYVVPIVTIEESHPNEPNAPDEWVEVTDSNLVRVTPTECFAGDKVTFQIQALTGHPPSKARVTVNAAFFTEGGETASGTEKTVMVLPAECACTGGGCSDAICDPSGEPPSPDGSPLPLFVGP